MRAVVQYRQYYEHAHEPNPPTTAGGDTPPRAAACVTLYLYSGLLECTCAFCMANTIGLDLEYFWIFTYLEKTYRTELISTLVQTIELTLQVLILYIHWKQEANPLLEFRVCSVLGHSSQGSLSFYFIPGKSMPLSSTEAPALGSKTSFSSPSLTMLCRSSVSVTNIYITQNLFYMRPTGGLVLVHTFSTGVVTL